MSPVRRRPSFMLLSALLVLPATSQVRGFDSGHHWEITAQVLNEMGFSADARQTVCVSNWLLDYYSSSPTCSGRVREELSKLHCDNLYAAASARHYLSHFMSNARSTLVAQCGDGTSDREVLLMLGAVLHVREIGKSLDTFVFGKPDFYLTGGAHFGRPPRKNGWPDGRTMLGHLLNPKSEPESPFVGQPNSVFRDRVLQSASSARSPWRTLIIADDRQLAANGHVLTYFLNVGEEDPGRDQTADISPVPGQHGIVFSYDLIKSTVTFPDTGEVHPAGRGKPVTIRGDHRKSAELVFEIYPVASK